MMSQEWNEKICVYTLLSMLLVQLLVLPGIS